MSERPPILMLRHGTHLVPASKFDTDALEAFPRDKALQVRVGRGRSSPQLRLYFKVLDLVAENADQDITGDDLHDWLKLRLGYTRPVRESDGTIREIPKSVAFHKMKQDEFNAYFNSVKEILTEAIIPGMDCEAFEREAREVLGLVGVQWSDESRRAA